MNIFTNDRKIILKDYILCTISKNEEDKISILLNDVVKQTIKPNLWVLVDDSSEDKTADIIKHYIKDYSWIRFFEYKDKRHSQILMHISKVKNFATCKNIEIAYKERINWEFIGIVDADIHIEPLFYEKMINRFSEDQKLGLLGAQIRSITKSGSLKLEEARDDLPGSATMLCRKGCFEEIGGVPSNMYPEDAIMVARAKLAGWKTERNQNIFGIQSRKSHSRKGEWKGFLLRGERIYFLRYSPIYVFLRTITIFFGKNPVMSLAFLKGYLQGFLSSAMRLNDPTLVNYFRRVRFKEIIKFRVLELCRKRLGFKKT